MRAQGRRKSVAHTITLYAVAEGIYGSTVLRELWIFVFLDKSRESSLGGPSVTLRLPRRVEHNDRE